MDSLQILADGDDGVRRLWPDEYLEQFYDYIPHRRHGKMRANSVITAEEQAALVEVSRIVDDARDATPANLLAEEFVATGWPKQIQRKALKALNLMRERGPFSDEPEEEVPPKTRR